jgi:MFS family permease
VHLPALSIQLMAERRIFLIYFVDSMQQQITYVLTPYVTSSFQLHSLTATTRILSQIIGGLSKLPLAKILDVWGRPQGFIITVFLLVVGLIMMAACQNVETYAAAQVFYWVGYNGIGYALSIFIADTSHLKNRGLMYAFASSPYIATTWIGGPAAESFLDGARASGGGLELLPLSRPWSARCSSSSSSSTTAKPREQV